MSTTIRVELDEDDYRRLRTEANRRGLSPESLARSLVQNHIPADRLTDEQIRKGRSALAWLAEFRKTIPAVDVTPYVEESRRQLEERGSEAWQKC